MNTKSQRCVEEPREPVLSSARSCAMKPLVPQQDYSNIMRRLEYGAHVESAAEGSLGGAFVS